jgi:DNA-binding NtrC family response regulator
LAAVYERNGAWHPVPMPIPLREVIRNAFLNALAYTDGDQSQAAKLLGVSPRMMHYNLMAYGIPTTKNRRRDIKRES